uniref:Matrix metallopeptidase 28 n=1 Tax=Cyprinodon variegatus TaxID=28743 RepID=A0A3Q2CMU8_CYPVA
MGGQGWPWPLLPNHWPPLPFSPLIQTVATVILSSGIFKTLKFFIYYQLLDNKNPLFNSAHQYTNIKDDKYRIHALFRTRFFVIWGREKIMPLQRFPFCREYQWLSRLPITGRLDSATLRQMAEPRCGVSDEGSQQVWAQRVNVIFTGKGQLDHRRRRSADKAEKWYKRQLTYQIVNWPRHLSQGSVQLAVRTAFQLWSNVSDLVFQEAPEGPADIRLAFYEGDHNDGTSNAFDGPGGTLAHAFLPRRGEAHFDMAERWTLNGHKGHNLFMVTAHEIGHTLGLEHSPVRHALMSPYYRKLGRSLVLSWDDILAVQQLYGKPLSNRPVRLPGKVLHAALQEWEFNELQSQNPGQPLYCHGVFDAITADEKQTVLVFRGSRFWTVSSKGSVSGPFILRQRWPGLPEAIEAAAFSPLDSKWYFFKGAAPLSCLIGLILF